MSVNPTPATSLTRPDLAASFDQFDLEASRKGFIGLDVLPVFESSKQSATFKKRTIEQLLIEAASDRTSGGDYNRGNWRFTEDNFNTKDQGFEETVDDRESAIYADYFDAEKDSADQARDVVLRNYERRVSTAVEAGITNTTAAGTAWSTVATASPIANIRAAQIAVRLRTGIVPDTLVLEWEAFQYLKDVAEVIDRLKYAGFTDPNRGNINEAAVAQALGIKNVIVAGAVRNTANEAVAATLAAIWTKTKAHLIKTASPGAPLNTVCLGRTIHWGEDGSRIGGVFETYREEGRRYQVVRQRMETDEKILYGACCQTITGVL